MKLNYRATINEVGEKIRYWRKRRGLSQLELSLHANISSKHISFLETGRSKPSREMLILLANAMDIPLHERNLMLRAMGFEEQYSRMLISQPEMDAARSALMLMLQNHEPFPALVMDWQWNILMANESQKKLSALLAAKQPRFPQTCNILEMLFDPCGLRPFVENWSEVAAILLQRIQREHFIRQNRDASLMEKLRSFPDVNLLHSAYNPGEKSYPMLYLTLKFDDIRLRLFSTLASFGTPVDITMQEMTIEQYFPVDKQTRLYFQDNAN